jgi:hypothetical protein
MGVGMQRSFPAGHVIATTWIERKKTMNAAQSAAQQVLTIWYQNEALRVVVDREVRFAVEDIQRIARADDLPQRMARDPRWARMTAQQNGVDIETVGWSQALNLIDMGDLASTDIQRFGEWFLTDVIEHLCDEITLTGTERIDTSSLQESSFFRKALAEMDSGSATLVQRLH